MYTLQHFVNNRIGRQEDCKIFDIEARRSDARFWRIYPVSCEIYYFAWFSLGLKWRWILAPVGTHTQTIARGPINNKSSETSGKRFFTYLRPYSASGRKSNRGFSLGILQYPGRGVRISVHSLARAPFNPRILLTYRRWLRTWRNGETDGVAGGEGRVADLGASARQGGGASWERLAPHNV